MLAGEGKKKKERKKIKNYPASIPQEKKKTMQNSKAR